jgi:AcrR family transcriptional regulator
MAIVVEHEKRKHEILAKALDLFVEEGYEDVTFQKIADRCGITRTTLYIYFKNKREIFLWSLKQLTSAFETQIMEVISDKSLSAEDCLRKMFGVIIDGCEENSQLFTILLTYLLQLSKSGVDPAERVTRRVIRLQHLMSTIIIRGIQDGEFKKVSVKEANSMFYSLIESAIFRLSVLNQKNIEDVRASLNLAINGILVTQEPAK